MATKRDNAEKYFQEVESTDRKEIARLQGILERRLPRSCFVYNQMVAFQRCSEDYSLYIFQNPSPTPTTTESLDPDENCTWIIFKLMREDWGQVVSFSPPTSSFSRELAPNVKEALENSSHLDWTQPFVLVCVDAHVSDFLIKVNLRKHGNTIKIYPSYLLAMKPAEALKLEIAERDDVVLAPLDAVQGSQVLCRQWPYTRPGTEPALRKAIEKLPSGGVFLRDANASREPVAGAILPGFGLLSCLFTDADHRRKGYASLVTKYVYKKMASEGFYPCLDTEVSDPNAVAFHKSFTGNEILSKADYICYKALM